MNKAEHFLNTVAMGVRKDLDEALRVLQSANSETISGDVARLDLLLRKAFERLDESTRFCEAHRPSMPREYDPVRLVRDEMGHFERVEDSLASEEPEEFWGDPEQIRLCLRLIVQTLARRRVAFSIRLFLDAQEPRIEITADEAAALPSSLSLGDSFVIAGEDFGHLWTAATEGGEVRLHDDLYVLYLVGDRTRATLQTVSETVRTGVAQAARTLSAWRGAIGQYEDGMMSPSEMLGVYERNVTRAMVLVDDVLSALTRG